MVAEAKAAEVTGTRSLLRIERRANGYGRSPVQLQTAKYLPGKGIMKHILAVLLTWIVAGCASDGDKAQWDEFRKDLRGDNMQMHADKSGMSDALPKSMMTEN
jgi:hypothetical protein